MNTYEQIFPPIETVLDMEPEELAPLVLKHLSESGQQKLNIHNYTLDTDPDFIKWAGDNHKRRQEVLQRFIVAWRWLERELFIAPQPGDINWVFITPRGRVVLESQDFDTYRKGHLLPSEGLDPVLVRKVKQAFIRGDYDTAVFQAFKEVEVRVRNKAGLSNSDIGVKLIRKAFNPTNGVFTDKSMDEGEQAARMELFTGAIGTYKNPASHRDVALSDPREAADIIHIANQLLRIVDSIQNS
ncbi:MAG: TIGR02391 family protein [Candidatus Niyogibacteria bacterium CG10_big_fil_rev_8_21_14_0_10_46_36]|uniref:TIGR02391 family protein n=1 Tax=Candidatus Niyogibacteria bacterium CG10_big_fil_rev_8_21_14_0_10_46_36 TaxID=1974726 RepID=A0A2H0TFN4_9BACT|nr:MAG: TIGR02391 family protein [Candidatus Niyogibacteria bacterium CG10_big_fil_rev_8_21_14_0_10_46_36]